MKKLLVGAAVLGSLLWPSVATAHDFFLLPVLFKTEGDGPIAIQATVGSTFPKPEIVVTADRAERALAVGQGNPQVRIAGTGPTALNLEVTGAQPGLLVTGVSSKPRDVDYAEDRIPLILGEYRVSAEAAAAVEALPRPRTWQVVSRRFAKTFLCVHSCADHSSAERSLGGHLEFVGSRSADHHFQLLADGKPLANYPFDIVDSTGKRQHLTTDARGELHLSADARGTMMLFAARLEPPIGAGRFTLDLTSLTFNRP